MPKKATPAPEPAAKAAPADKSEPKVTMEQLVQQKSGDLIPYRVGNVVECVVLHATSKVIYVDVGGIAMGVIPEREMSALPKSLHFGDNILASVIGLEDYKGNMVLSMRRADRDRIHGQLTTSYEDGTVIDVVVSDANKGGLLINVGDYTGFLPVSQLASRHYPKVDGGNTDEIFAKLKELIGQTLQVKVITFEPKAGKLIFSEKAAGDKEQEERIKGIAVGDTMEGVISGIVDFGLFIQLNNEGKDLEGLIHISEVAWGRVANLDERFQIGQKIKALVVSTDDNRVSLSLKRLTPDPWKDIEQRYQMNDIVAGSVTRITPFGVFVKLDDEIDGLVHVSELSDERVNDPADILSPAQTYHFKVISVEPKKHRLGLSYKQAIGAKLTDTKNRPVKKADAKPEQPADTTEVKLETAAPTEKPAEPATETPKAAAKKPIAKKAAPKKAPAKEAAPETAAETPAEPTAPETKE